MPLGSNSYYRVWVNAILLAALYHEDCLASLVVRARPTARSSVVKLYFLYDLYRILNKNAIAIYRWCCRWRLVRWRARPGKLYRFIQNCSFWAISWTTSSHCNNRVCTLTSHMVASHQVGGAENCWLRLDYRNRALNVTQSIESGSRRIESSSRNNKTRSILNTQTQSTETGSRRNESGSMSTESGLRLVNPELCWLSFWTTVLQSCNCHGFDSWDYFQSQSQH